MDPVSAVLGAMASLPQCLQAARILYDMRNRFRDASMLITAIYSESMVIAASLSQVQNLLHYQTLQSKPQLLETFDRAITGCRVVYECLQDEVRDLVIKVENENLMFKDKAKFLWKADNFKELLQQIRGQQMTLSLLIQGLQMESLADIRNLVADNSVTLDQVVKRSKTLRQEHPRVHVPESIFTHEDQVGDAADAESILKSTEFAFDDQVINSKAYRKAMALYTSKNHGQTLGMPRQEPEEDDLTVVDSTHQVIDGVEDSDINRKTSSADLSISTSADEEHTTDPEKKRAQNVTAGEDEGTFDSIHQDLFDSLEHDILAYMPSNASNASYLSNFDTSITEKSITPIDNTLTPAPLRQSVQGQSSLKKEKSEEDEKPPPLPPRRPSGHPSFSDAPKKLSVSSDNSTNIFDMLSKVSSASSYTTFNSSQSISTISRKPMQSSFLPEVVKSRNSSDKDGQLFSAQDLLTMPSQLQSVDMHNIWMSLANSDRAFFDRMTQLRTTFYDSVIQKWPILEKHLGAVLIGEQLANLNKEILLQTMEQQLQERGDSACNPAIFEIWTNKSQKLYREYCQRMPHATSSLRTTQNMDPTFAPFVKTLDLNSEYFSTSLEEHFRLPIVQLQLYIDSLQNLTRIVETLNVTAGHEEMNRLQRAVEAVTWLKTMTHTIIEDSQNRENIQNIEKRLHTLNADLLSQLRLLEPSRRIMFQGGMAIKLKGNGPWNPVHVILLDNYLIWGKAKTQKKGKGDKIFVLDAPIAINDLEVTLPIDSNQFQKTTMFDKIAQGSVVYLITVRDKSSMEKPHLFGAFGYQERNEWWNHLSAATSAQVPAA